jgi:formylmethanofuran dehydrogenase subunit C
MKRGTIACLGPAPHLLPTFRYACTYRPVFVALYLRQLRAWGFAVEDRHFGGDWKRYCGDPVTLGKGEILAWQAP